MTNFTDKLSTKDSSITEIAQEILQNANSEKIAQLIEYTQKRQDVFYLPDSDYDHIFKTPLNNVKALSKRVLNLKQSSDCLMLASSINMIDNEPHYDSATATMVYDKVNHDQPFFGVNLFREQAGQGFSDGNITNDELQQVTKLADDVQEHFVKIRKLGMNLEHAANQQQSGVSF